MKANELLKAWLKDEGRKSSWLAKHCMADQSTVSHWVNGNRMPHAVNRAAIERLTGIPASAWVAE